MFDSAVRDPGCGVYPLWLLESMSVSRASVCRRRCRVRSREVGVCHGGGVQARGPVFENQVGPTFIDMFGFLHDHVFCLSVSSINERQII